jgi:peptidoglycan/LPS O-acetylase OafA/YrhL
VPFRKNINGLRAIALIAVVLFHFYPSYLAGGFAGVDVFFVISGFLMTGIIVRGVENNNFSLPAFYLARARRLFPALAVVCLCLFVFGWFYLLPSEYKALGKHLGSSMGFFSNIIYARESGYFDVAAHQKWLLHTWSLSVEWQFYLIYPLILLLLCRTMSLMAMKRVLLLATVLAFVASVWFVYRWPLPAYYLLPTRVWELMIGGLAYFYPFHLCQYQQKICQRVGLGLIIVACLFIPDWSVYLTLVAVIGAFLFLQANRSQGICSESSVLQSLGLWSYSIYLWHWPILVGINYFSLGKPFKLVGIGLCVLLGFLTHRYVESLSLKDKALKKYKGLSPVGALKSRTLYFALLIFCLGWGVYVYPFSYAQYQIPTQWVKSMQRGDFPCFDKEGQDTPQAQFCHLVDGKRKLFAFGDSHAYSVLPELERLAKAQDLDLTYTGYSGCAPLLGIYPKRNDQAFKNCHALNNKVFDYLKSHPLDLIFLAARWSYYTVGNYDDTNIQLIGKTPNGAFNQAESIKTFEWALQKTFKAYATLGAKIVILLQVPMQEQDPAKIYHQSITEDHLDQNRFSQLSVSLSKHLKLQKMTNEMILEAARPYKNIQVIDPTRIFCNQSHCPAGDLQSSYYFNLDHLSAEGSFKLNEVLKDSFSAKAPRLH